MFQCPQQCPGVQGSSAPATEQAEWQRELFGTWCSCPLGTTASVCPVPHGCGHSCVPAPLPGTPRAAEGESKGARLVQLGGRREHDSMHKAWHLQGKGWLSLGRDFHVGRGIVQGKEQQELSCTHGAGGGRAQEEQ